MEISGMLTQKEIEATSNGWRRATIIDRIALSRG